ncbi:MAG: DUF3791 domain-containing protein [Prevotellaceae bacterium]|nr:DUF3791 domain-containing protein [Prevotellaceae bacterium]MCD8303701.1 DUF3791 domain-containing protein [Prevotellaceae bacterium]
MTKTTDVRQIVLDMKIARIIDLYSSQHGVSLAEAADSYYKSVTARLIEDGVADLHCRSDQYLADELWLELHETLAKT